MEFGELPENISAEQVISKLDLSVDEYLLFACKASTTEFPLSETWGVIAFTDFAIYWLNAKTLAVYKKHQIIDFHATHFSRSSTYLSFTEENWNLNIDKSDRKTLKKICASKYSHLSDEPQEKFRNDLAADKKQELVGKKQAFDERYGEIVLTARFGVVKKVSLHSKGFVSGLGSQPERLLAISGDADITKKSGAGRALGALASRGNNLFMSNMRGDVYITIVTDVKTHTIHIKMQNQVHGANPVGEMRKLVTAGELLIKQNQ